MKKGFPSCTPNWTIYKNHNENSISRKMQNYKHIIEDSCWFSDSSIIVEFLFRMNYDNKILFVCLKKLIMAFFVFDIIISRFSNQTILFLFFSFFIQVKRTQKSKKVC